VIASVSPRVVHSAPRVATFCRRSAVARVAVFFVCLVSLSLVGVAGQSTRVDTSAIGPKVGQSVPDFSGTDQFGRRYTLASSMGAKGAMLVFFRSADW
jgi:cytochrome oxidase Cu insertion factor (SCO1/SenC/PrrC family)